MKSCEFVLFTVLCLVMYTVRSKLQYTSVYAMNEIKEFGSINRNRNWMKKSSSNSELEQVIRKREASSSRGGIDVNEIGCSRYCIKKTDNTRSQSVKRVNLIWTVLDDSRVTFTEETSTGREKTEPSTQKKDFSWELVGSPFNRATSFTDNNPKCEFYVEIGCGSHNEANGCTCADECSNRDELAAMNVTEGYTEREFNVENFIEELRISVLGKISQAIVEIPIASQAEVFADAGTPRPTFSLSRMSDRTEVHVRNPPPGEWWLKVLGEENSKYDFSIVVSMNTMAEHGNATLLTTASLQTELEKSTKAKLSASQRPGYLRLSEVNVAAQQPITADDQQTFGNELLSGKRSVDELDKLHGSVTKRRKFPNQSARPANFEAEVINEVAKPFEVTKMTESLELEELLIYPDGIRTAIRKAVVDISPNNQFSAVPGPHDVVFTVTNSQAVAVRYAFTGQSTSFPVLSVLPYNRYGRWIRSGEALEVAVRIQVPNTQNTSPSIVTLYVSGTENLEVATKSAYVYVQGSSTIPHTSNDQPCIDYSFNNNCNGKLDHDRCNKSIWSVDVTVRDPRLGLRTVASLPKGVQPTTEFIAGTRDLVHFYYYSTCCYRTVNFMATDIQGHVYTRTIEVTEWNNLSTGEVAAIILGALLLLLFIVVIILLIVYCIRKRKSHDLTFSQRYGSRTPTNAERTNF